MNTTVATTPENTWLDRSLGDLARSVPGATAVFFRHGLDFCCGGKTSLRKALDSKGLDAGPLVDELSAMLEPLATSSDQLILTGDVNIRLDRPDDSNCKHFNEPIKKKKFNKNDLHTKLFQYKTFCN